MLKQYLEVGKIVGTHGLQGEVRVEAWCDSIDFFCAFKTLYFDEGTEKLSVKSRPNKRIAIMKIEGIDTLEQAESLRSKVLYMNRSDVKLAEGENFVQDLIGLEVSDFKTGMVYGKITDVIKTGANDVYQVTNENKKDYLIPVIDDVIEEVDIHGGTLKITPIKGLFDDED